MPANMMKKWFNTAGLFQADIHYILPASDRLPELVDLINQRNYFVIHAPRQTGKTTAMMSLAQELTASGKYNAVMVSVEVGSAFPNEHEKAEQAILSAWRDKEITEYIAKDANTPITAELVNQVKEILNQRQDTHLDSLAERYGKVTLAMELKVWRDRKPDPLNVGLKQLDKYLSGLNLDTGWLVILIAVRVCHHLAIALLQKEQSVPQVEILL